MNSRELRMQASWVMPAPASERTSKAIGTRLVATRNALGLNQREVCRRARIAPNTYNQWETGRTRPQLDEAMKLVDTFDLSLDWIYLGDPSRLPYHLGAAITARSDAPGGVSLDQ